MRGASRQLIHVDANRRRARLLSRARGLRKNQTNAEALLWRSLRDHRFAGRKFRRQHRIGGYIVDFFCAEAGLVIELDGSEHAIAPRISYDRTRTEFLQRLELRVLRFWNSDVASNLDGVLTRIAEALAAASP